MTEATGRQRSSDRNPLTMHSGTEEAYPATMSAVTCKHFLKSGTVPITTPAFTLTSLCSGLTYIEEETPPNAEETVVIPCTEDAL